MYYCKVHLLLSQGQTLLDLTEVYIYQELLYFFSLDNSKV